MLNYLSQRGRIVLSHSLRHRCVPPLRHKSDKKVIAPESSSTPSKTFSDDRVSSDLTANPDKALHPEQFRDELDIPMKDPKLQKMGVDEMYEKFMELKDFDAEGRPRRGTYARIQQSFLEEGAIAPHIIMDENRADFLIIGGGLAGNILANRTFNALQSINAGPQGTFMEETENDLK